VEISPLQQYESITHSLQLWIVAANILNKQLRTNDKGWSKLHDLYSSSSKIRIMKPRRMRWEEHIAGMGEKRNAYRLLVGKPERKRPLGRPRLRWVDNIRMDLVEVGWDDVD
jgi:hypothetical protein